MVDSHDFHFVLVDLSGHFASKFINLSDITLTISLSKNVSKLFLEISMRERMT